MFPLKIGTHWWLNHVKSPYSVDIVGSLPMISPYFLLRPLPIFPHYKKKMEIHLEFRWCSSGFHPVFPPVFHPATMAEVARAAPSAASCAHRFPCWISCEMRLSSGVENMMKNNGDCGDETYDSIWNNMKYEIIWNIWRIMNEHMQLIKSPGFIASTEKNSCLQQWILPISIKPLPGRMVISLNENRNSPK